MASMANHISDEDIERIKVARAEAVALGYMLIVDEAPNVEPLTHMAFAGPHVIGQAANARFLTYSTSAADAAEAGLEVLRGIVERGEPWPE
jgi:hypothetical protein